MGNLIQQAQELTTQLTGISKIEKRFLLLRMTGVTRDEALQLCGVERGSYEQWLRHPIFQALNLRLEELRGLHKNTALILLRRENLLSTVILEEKIIQRLITEIDAMCYDLIKTPIAKEVYNKMVRELETMAIEGSARAITFQERLMRIDLAGTGGPTVDAQNTTSVADSPLQLVQGQPVSVIEQTSSEDDEESQEG